MLSGLLLGARTWNSFLRSHVGSIYADFLRFFDSLKDRTGRRDLPSQQSHIIWCLVVAILIIETLAMDL